MRLRLDTHSFLWFIAGDAKLSATAQALIGDPANERLLSVASLWEMAIKFSLGHLQLAQPFHLLIPHELTRNDMTLLPIHFSHTAAVASLPFHHKDPFDRLIIAQSLVEDIPVLGIDPQFDAYGVTRLW